MRGRLLCDRGVTLVEMTIVLLTVVILAGAAAPSVKRTLDQTRMTRALSDESAIKTAVINFLNDMGGAGYTGFTINGASGGTTTETLVSDGDMPRECTAAFGCGGGAISWNALVDNTGGLTDFLERHLVTNTPRGSAANNYPFANGWHGAYLTAPIDPDPWGNRYAVNVKWLKDNSTCGTRSNDTFVMSAGPNEVIETNYRFDQPNCNSGNGGTGGAFPSGDDIITVIKRDSCSTCTVP